MTAENSNESGRLSGSIENGAVLTKLGQIGQVSEELGKIVVQIAAVYDLTVCLGGNDTRAKTWLKSKKSLKKPEYSDLLKQFCLSK